MNEKYAFVLGTTAEFIKVVSIMLEFQKRKIPYLFIHTGQHNIEKIIKLFKVKNPDIIIDQRNGFKTNTGGAFSWGVKIIPNLISCLKKRKNIKYVLVHGDTISCFSGTISAKLSGKRIIHIEAGLRSGNLFSPLPEESIRRIVDFLSDIKFSPSEKSKNRLNGIVYNTGNTVFDALKIYNNPKNILNLQNPYAVASIHRNENIRSKERMKKIVDILSYSKIPVYWFLHENTHNKLIEYDLMKYVDSANILLKDPLEYFQFIHILKNAQFVLSDGGGISCECAALNVPILLLRNETEREEYLNRWDQVLTKFDKDIARTAINKFFLPRKKYILENPYYRKYGASKKIVDILEKLK